MRGARDRREIAHNGISKNPIKLNTALYLQFTWERKRKKNLNEQTEMNKWGATARVMIINYVVAENMHA